MPDWFTENTPDLGMIADQAADLHGVDRNLVRTVAHIESGFNPKAVSPAGAMGVMQLMPKTAAQLGVTNPWDAAENIAGGAKYLAQLNDRYGGDPRLVLAAYNAGPGAVDKSGGVPPYRETQEYVNRGLKRLGAVAPAPAAPAAPAPAAAPAADWFQANAPGTAEQAPAKPPEPSPLEKAGRAFWESVGGPQIMDIAGGLTGTPERLERARQALSGVAQGFAAEPGRVMDELTRTGQAMVNLDVPGTAYHLAGAVPLLGAPAQQIAQDVARGAPAEAIGHTAGLLAPFVAGPAARAAGGAARTAAELTGAGIRAAAPDVLQGAAKAAGGAAITSTLPIPQLGKYIVGTTLTKPGLSQMMQGVKTGIAAARNLPVEQAAAEAAARAAAVAAEDASHARQLGVNEALESMTAPPAQLALPPASSIAQPAAGTYAEAERLRTLGPEPVKPAAPPVEPPATAPAPPSGTPTLDELSHSLAGKPFSKLNADAKARVQLIQDRILRAASAPETASGTPPAPAAAPVAAPVAAVPPVVPVEPPVAPPAAVPETQGFARVGEAGSAIVNNMYDSLWDKVLKGKTTEAGGPSVVLQAAKLVREAGGLQTPEQFRQFAREYARVPRGDGFQQAMRDLVTRWKAAAAVPETAAAPVVPEPVAAQVAQAPEALAPVPETPEAAPPAPRPSFAEAARAKKVDALFEAMTRNKIPRAMVEKFGPDEWRILADYAGVKPPSETSIGQLLQRLADYEKGQAIPLTGSMTPAEAETAFEEARRGKTKARVSR